MLKILDCAFSPKLHNRPQKGPFKAATDAWIDLLDGRCLTRRDFITAMEYYLPELHNPKAVIKGLYGGGYLYKDLIVVSNVPNNEEEVSYRVQGRENYRGLVKIVYYRRAGRYPTEGLYLDVIRAWKDFNGEQPIEAADLQAICSPLDLLHKANTYEVFIMGEPTSYQYNFHYAHKRVVPLSEPLEYVEITIPKSKSKPSPFQADEFFAKPSEQLELPLFEESLTPSQLPLAKEEEEADYDKFDSLIFKLQELISHKKSLEEEATKIACHVSEIDQALQDIKERLKATLAN